MIGWFRRKHTLLRQLRQCNRAHLVALAGLDDSQERISRATEVLADERLTLRDANTRALAILAEPERASGGEPT